jgi:hypothetical protein
MTGPSTRAALNSRALSTANWLEAWAGRLTEKAIAQDAKFFKRRSEPVALKQVEVMGLINGMYEHMRELRRYSERPRRSMRRSPRGFAP